MPPDAPPLSRRALRVLLVAVALQVLFVFFFVVPAHKPEPNGLPVAVVAPPAGASQFTAALRQRGDFEVRRAATAKAAERLILDREVYGAFVLEPGGAIRSVLTASAASAPVAQLLQELGERGGSFETLDVRALPPEDPRGITLNVLVLAVVITAILGALLAINIVPDLGLLPRVGLAALSGVIGGLAVIALVNGWLDALGGPWLPEAALIALAVVAIALPSAGLIRLLGPPGTAVPFLLFLMLGNPASGAASAPELLPTPWAELGQFLPPGALGSALRGASAFDGAGAGMPVLVLVAWAAIGVALLALSERRAPAAAPA
jgi:hypothetical protein